MILGVFAYGAIGLLALTLIANAHADKVACLCSLGAFGSAYASQYGGAMGWKSLSLAGLAGSLVLAAVAFVRLALY